VLFDGRFGVRAAKLLDVRRDVHGRYPRQIRQTFVLTPTGKSLYGFEVGTAGVRVADGEELRETAAPMRNSSKERRQAIRNR
jgi:hypothetical protein